MWAFLILAAIGGGWLYLHQQQPSQPTGTLKPLPPGIYVVPMTAVVSLSLANPNSGILTVPASGLAGITLAPGTYGPIPNSYAQQNVPSAGLMTITIPPAIAPGPAPAIPGVTPVAPAAPPAVPPASPPLNLPNIGNVQSLPPPYTATWTPIGTTPPGNGTAVNVTIGGAPVPITFPATIYALMADGITAAINMAGSASSFANVVPGFSLPAQFWAVKGG